MAAWRRAGACSSARFPRPPTPRRSVLLPTPAPAKSVVASLNINSKEGATGFFYERSDTPHLVGEDFAEWRGVFFFFVAIKCHMSPEVFINDEMDALSHPPFLSQIKFYGMISRNPSCAFGKRQPMVLES